MRTTIELPESIYQQNKQVARQKEHSIEQFVVQVLERVLEAEPSAPAGSKPVTFPLISVWSKKTWGMSLSALLRGD